MSNNQTPSFLGQHVSILVSIKRLFGQAPAQGEPEPGTPIPPATPPNPAPLFKGEPIPAYPDKGVAAPAASPEALLESQKDLINRLHQASSFSHEDFTRLIRPAILNYAAYVHLLPASESHHHCGQGGLFRHGLEVALNAAIACNAKIFAFDHWASQRDKLVPRWRMCAILGGMIHDMGKPIIDVGAVDGSGDLVWNPHSGSLWEWLQEHELDHYYIHWREGARHKRHEVFNALAIDRIFPRETIRWLTQHGGQEAMDALVMSLSGTVDPHNPLSAIIKGADSKSVDKDIKDSRARLAASGMGGQRNLAVRVIRTIHDLLEKGTWEVNRVGDPMWVTGEGVFGMYPKVISDAIDEMRAKGEQSLVRDASAILQSLADWGFIHPNVTLTGQTFNTWWVKLGATDRGKPIEFNAHVVRFTKEEVIPASLLPKQPATAVILDKDGNPVTPGGVVEAASSQSGKDSQEQQAPAADQPAAQQEDMTTVPPLPEADAAKTGGTPDASSPTPAKPKSHQNESAQTKGNYDTVGQDMALISGGGEEIDLLYMGTVPPEETSLPDEPPVVPGEPEPLRDRSKEIDIREQQMLEAVRNISAKWPPMTPQEATLWFRGQGYEGNLILALFQLMGKGEYTEGTDIIDVDECVHLSYPKCLSKLGLDPLEIVGLFDGKEWIKRNPSTPRRATVSRKVGSKDVSFLRLNENVSQAVRLLMPARNPTAEQDKPKRRVLPFGKYIDEFSAARIRSNVAVNTEKEDAVLIRPGFSNFLDDHIRDTQPGRPLEDLSNDELQELVTEFARMHRRLNRRSILFWLTCQPNQILTAVGSGLSDTRKSLSYNPAYDRDADVAAGHAMEPASE